MDFSWSEEQIALRRSIVDFARRELAAGVIADDRAEVFQREKWRKCANVGIHGLAVPEEFGGTDADALSIMVALEALGYGCPDAGLIFAINAQMWAVQAPLVRFGNEPQKQRYLPALVRGDLIAAHGITEQSSGSDAFALSATAVKRGDDYLLNGAKLFVSNAPIADLFLIFASTSRARGFMGITAFLIERGAAGLTVGRPMEKMGLRTSPMAEVVLEDCVVPASCRLGREGNGGSIFKHAMGWERTFILASVVGAMQRQLDACVAYARTRQQFGQPIGKFQSISNKLVDMKLRLETARLLLYRAGWLRMQGEESADSAALAKLCISEAFVASSLDAVQIHGGYGYATESGIERDLRDAVGSRIYSGTSEIQRELIARGLGL